MTLAARMIENARRIAHPCPVCLVGSGRQCIGRHHAARPVGTASPELVAFVRANVR